MENQKDPLLNPQDELLAENNLLKMKLELEHGMLGGNSSSLSPDVENQWLKSVYAFEQQFKNVKRVKVYDRIGRPVFKKWDTLTAQQTSEELARLRVIMENTGVELDCICSYDDAIIYKFLTEELFEKEMDDMQLPGMVYHFIYEEFYPNHDHDLRRDCHDLVKAICGDTWIEQFHAMAFTEEVTFSEKTYDRKGISSLIVAFQDAHQSLEIEKFEIRHLTIETDLSKADAQGMLSLSGKMKDGDPIRYEGACSFQFLRRGEYWYVSELYLPGFSIKKE